MADPRGHESRRGTQPAGGGPEGTRDPAAAGRPGPGPAGGVAPARGLAAVRDLRLARTALWLLAVSSAFTGIPAASFPRTFFDDFPFPSAWVDLLPPFNQHLVTDVGGFFCAFAVLFAWAALRPSRELVVPLCASWSVAAVLHLVFHATHLGGFGVADAVGELFTLALLVALPAVAVWALPGADAPTRGA
ncbi:hypothetical protein AB0L40_22535 [Patulibacter sp. NPDC049589]|uniref:hypothetical protein n=1 Tax=Patulibacter sp. NPDC049589 TaxID=3154731 RepID=UPI0034469394